MEVEVACEVCGVNFNVPKKKIKFYADNNFKFYCSNECRNSVNKRSITTTCANCGCAINKTFAQIARSKSGNLFCSRSCSTSYNNRTLKVKEKSSQYVDGRASYRNIALRGLPQKCFVCGFDILEALDVHHIDKNRLNNNISNLLVLCKNHHTLVHRNKIKLNLPIA